MQRVIRRCILVLVSSLLPQLGCGVAQVWLQLPSFGSIHGVWIWRLSEETQDYQRVCRVRFDDTELVNGQEVVPYVQECAAGPGSGSMLACVQRDASNRDAVKLGLRLVYAQKEGVYRVSAYGDDWRMGAVGDVAQPLTRSAPRSRSSPSRFRPRHAPRRAPQPSRSPT